MLQSMLNDAENQQEAPAPEATYNFEVNQAEFKDTKKGDGTMLAVTLKFLDGPKAGSLLWHNFLIKHPNAWTVNQGAADCRAFLKACGSPGIEHPEDLLGTKVAARVLISTQTNGMVSNIIEQGGWLPQQGQRHNGAPQNVGSSMNMPPPRPSELDLESDSIPF